MVEENIDDLITGGTETTTTPDPITPEPDVEEVVEKQETQPKKKIFSRKDIRRTVPVGVTLPTLYPGYEPWEFVFRLKLSQEAEDRREDFISLAATEQLAKRDSQILDEVCDLLVELPKGFDDLKYDGNSAGSSFKTYVETCEDDEGRDILYKIADGANRLYWRAIMPQEFRR